MTTAREALASTITEADWQGFVTSYAALRGWAVYHTYDSRRSAAGFPDLVMLRGGRLVVAELKSAKGKTTPAQRRWLDAFGEVAAVADTVEVYCWRPTDEAAVIEVLR